MARKTEPLDPALVRMALSIVVGALAVILNTTIVSVALPTLADEFGVGLDTISWVTTAYLLAMFVAIPLSGWAQSRIGGTRLWMAALALFTLGSALSASAWSAESLIAFRSVQGLGGGVIIPLMATLLRQASGGRNFGRLLSMVALPTAIGPILGPVVGGLILGSAPWEWLFAVSVPFGLTGIYLAGRTFKPDAETKAKPLDLPGALLATTGIVTFIYGLSNVPHPGGVGHPDVLVPGGVGLALVATFALYALRRGDRALLDLRLMRFRGVSVAGAAMFVFGLTLHGGMFLLPLFYQELRGSTPLATGLLLIPQGLGALTTRALAGRVVDAFGPRWVGVAGFALIGLGTVPFAFADVGTSPYVLAAALYVRGLGLGAALIPALTVAYYGLEHSDVPDATIITRVVQQVGGSSGVALLAVVLSTQLAGAATSAAQSTAYDNTFWWSVIGTGLGVAVSLAMPGREAGSRAESHDERPSGGADDETLEMRA